MYRRTFKHKCRNPTMVSFFPHLLPHSHFCTSPDNAAKGLCPWRGQGFPSAPQPVSPIFLRSRLTPRPPGALRADRVIPLRLLRPVTLPPPLIGVGLVGVLQQQSP